MAVSLPDLALRSLCWVRLSSFALDTKQLFCTWSTRCCCFVVFICEHKTTSCLSKRFLPGLFPSTAETKDFVKKRNVQSDFQIAALRLHFGTGQKVDRVVGGSFCPTCQGVPSGLGRRDPPSQRPNSCETYRRMGCRRGVAVCAGGRSPMFAVGGMRETFPLPKTSR